MYGHSAAYKLEVSPAWTVAVWLGSIALLFAFAYRSTNRVFRLRSDPPPEFFDVRVNWSVERRQAEERPAKAYWECAVTFLQSEHPYGSALPDNPPPEFRADTNVAGEELASDPATRIRYWRRLQKVWLLPQTWKTTVDWDTNWFLHPI